MALPGYGSTEQTSTIIATGSTRDESTSTRRTRRSLADELHQLDENTEQEERNTNPVRRGREGNGRTNPTESSDGDVTDSPMMESSQHTDDVNSHVLLTNDIESQNHDLDYAGNSPERAMERLIHDDNQNNIDNDGQYLEDSMSRNRSVTNTSTVNTHSEAEECNESDFSIAMSTDTITFRRRSRTGSLFSDLLTPRSRRRRKISRPGAIVTDSYADECICCCSIL